MQEVMARHFRVCDRHNELFLTLYPGLEEEAAAAGEVHSPKGTEQAAEEVWEWLRSVSKMTRAHRLTKTKTWFEPLVVMALGIKVHTAYLYVLCILCKEQGHFKTIADMPVHGGALPPSIVEELPGEAILSRKMEGRIVSGCELFDFVVLTTVWPHAIYRASLMRSKERILFSLSVGLFGRVMGWITRISKGQSR